MSQKINILILSAIITFFGATTIAPATLLAANPGALDRLKATSIGLDQPEEQSLTQQIGAIIGIFLAFLGISFLIQSIWAGYTWMTAGGNEEKLTKGKKALRNSMIGLLITLSTYALSVSILSRISSITIEEAEVSSNTNTGS